jgi:ActR/RegA family two-component response regulator
VTCLNSSAELQERKSMPQDKLLFVLAQNLFFLPRIMTAAKHSGLSMKLTNTESDFWKAYDSQTPTLVLVDLEGDPEVWHKVLEELQSREAEINLVAYGPHSDVDGMKLAKTLGCDPVLTKGEFSRDMQKMMVQYSESAVR